jgi:hypothetical protein
MKKNSFKIKLNDSKVFEFLTSEHLFTPTGTSELLVTTVLVKLNNQNQC